MRVFLVGASGAIGTRLVPQLIQRGHEVVGTARSPRNAERVAAQGARPVVLDLLDAAAVRKAVLEAEPEAIVHEATALGEAVWGRNFDKVFAGTNELRTKGTDALLAAAREAEVPRFVAQSFAAFRYVREGGPVKTEDDPLDSKAPANAQESWAAMASGREGHRGGRDHPPLRRLLRRRQRWADRAGAQAPVPDRRRRRWLHLLDPPRGRRRGHGPRARARRPGDLQHRRRRAGAGARVAAGVRRGPRRQAAPARSGLAGTADGRRGRGCDGYHRPRGVERQGQARARLDAVLPELAGSIPGGLRALDCIQGAADRRAARA